MNKDFILDFVAGGEHIALEKLALNCCFQGVSAAVSKTVVAPLERVKLLLQIQVEREIHCDKGSQERLIAHLSLIHAYCSLSQDNHM